MKSTIAIIATVLLVGCNSEKVKTLNVDLAANECKNIVYNTVVSTKEFTEITYKCSELKEAVMYVASVECTKTVNNFTRGVKIERTTTLAEVTKPSDASIEMVYNKIHALKGLAKHSGENIAYSRVVMK